MITAKIFLRLFLAMYLVIVALLLITYFTTPFYGDLTRIGLLPEALFGWRQPQPSVPESLLKSVKADEADVVVIGDSFSANLVWQSTLVSKGLRVKTLHWDDFGSLCENVPRWLNAAGFRDKGIVVIESVQSVFEKRLDDSLSCRGATQPLTDIARSSGSPMVMPLLGSDARNGTEKITTGIAQLWNGYLVKKTDGAQRFGSRKSHDVPLVQPVARGCEWFSHVFCSKALFIERDSANAPLGDGTLDKIKKIDATLSGYQVMWLIVPDKSTIYFEKDTTFWRKLASDSLGPNLYDPLLLARDTTKDLYMPNDTHLSTTGFLLLGKNASEFLATRQ